MEWTEKEFKRVAVQTRLGEKTVAACHDVLVLGTTGAEAAERHGLRPPHVSRGLKVLGEKRTELRALDAKDVKALKLMEAVHGVTSLLNAAAREAAQSIKGEGWIIRESVPGDTYEGAGVVKVGGFFVQDIGRVGVLHSLQDLASEPMLGKRLEIVYPRTEGKGVVNEIALGLGTRSKER